MKKKKEIIFPGVDLAGVYHEQLIKKLNKTKMSYMNTIITTQRIFTIRMLIIMIRLIRKNWMGY